MFLGRTNQGYATDTDQSDQCALLHSKVRNTLKKFLRVDVQGSGDPQEHESGGVAFPALNHPDIVSTDIQSLGQRLL